MLIKKLDFEKTKSTYYSTFNFDITKVGLVFSKSNFFITKFLREEIWRQPCFLMVSYIDSFATNSENIGGFHLYLFKLDFINQFYSIMTRLVQLSLANG